MVAGTPGPSVFDASRGVSGFGTPTGLQEPANSNSLEAAEPSALGVAARGQLQSAFAEGRDPDAADLLLKTNRGCYPVRIDEPLEAPMELFSDMAADVASQDADEVLASMIEGEIIPRLLLSHRPPTGPGARQSGDSLLFDLDRIDAFAQLSVREGRDTLMAELDGLLTRGYRLDQIFIDLLAPAARRLGAYWDNDDMTFTDVTLGLCHLRQVFEALRSRVGLRAGAPVEPNANQPSILLGPPPGEQHNFGLALVEHLFTTAGWYAVCDPAPTLRSMLRMVGQQRFDAVGLTVSCDGVLATLPQLILAVRKASLNKQLMVIVGGSVLNLQPDRRLALGADMVANDGADAAEKAFQMVQRRLAVHA
jgi:MerR family transcriptional regulator, light-induced transcriptional regulator